MERPFTILVADRNKNVREFLKRELALEGYIVMAAKNLREVKHIINLDDHLDLLIMELYLPIGDVLALLEKLKNRSPRLPVVIYTLCSEYVDHPAIKDKADAVIEKSGDGGPLKAAVTRVLNMLGAGE